jgi:hypothetical protein
VSKIEPKFEFNNLKDELTKTSDEKIRCRCASNYDEVIRTRNQV